MSRKGRGLDPEELSRLLEGDDSGFSSDSSSDESDDFSFSDEDTDGSLFSGLKGIPGIAPVTPVSFQPSFQFGTSFSAPSTTASFQSQPSFSTPSTTTSIQSQPSVQVKPEPAAPTEIPFEKKQIRLRAVIDPSLPYFVFSGSLPSDSEGDPNNYFFSNEAPSLFTMETLVRDPTTLTTVKRNQEYISVLQRLMEQKAVRFNDSVQQAAILKWSSDPTVRVLLQADTASGLNRPPPEYLAAWSDSQKRYWDSVISSIVEAGKYVQGAVESQWNRERSKIAEEAILQKYLAAPGRQAHLLNTGFRPLVAAYPKDSVWGTGVNFERSTQGPDQEDKDKGWRRGAQNLQGQVLALVRHRLRYPDSQYRDIEEKAPRTYIPQVRPTMVEDVDTSNQSISIFNPVAETAFSPQQSFNVPTFSAPSFSLQTTQQYSQPTDASQQTFTPQPAVNLPTYTPTIVQTETAPSQPNVQLPTFTPTSSQLNEPLVNLPTVMSSLSSSLPFEAMNTAAAALPTQQIADDAYITAVVSKLRTLLPGTPEGYLTSIARLFYQKTRTGCSYDPQIEAGLAQAQAALSS